jgi:AcrR family transcriptional regulator
MLLFRARFEMLERICEISEKLFMRYGIKSITMDEVAKELGISKKTLYQWVNDKDDLVRKTLLLHTQSMDLMCMKVFKSEQNAILQILKIAEMLIVILKEMNPSLLFDLKKYHPVINIEFTQHRDNTIQNQLIENLRLGIKQNLYKANINIPLTTGFYMALIEQCLSSEISILSNVPFAEKYSYLVKYHLNSICTNEGIEFMNNHISSEIHDTIQL